jgi:tellurite resistance protein
MRFDSKISSLEEREDLGTLSMDELHGIFTAYEMRTEQENPVTKEATFKASKKTKKKHKKNQNQVAVAVMIQTKMKRWLTS